MNNYYFISLLNSFIRSLPSGRSHITVSRYCTRIAFPSSATLLDYATLDSFQDIPPSQVTFASHIPTHPYPYPCSCQKHTTACTCVPVDRYATCLPPSPPHAACSLQVTRTRDGRMETETRVTQKLYPS